MTDREVMKMALEALQVATTPLAADRQEVLKAQQALRQALAQPEQDKNEICKRLCDQARRNERGACHQIVWDYGFSRIDNEEVQAACVYLAQAIRGRGKHE